MYLFVSRLLGDSLCVGGKEGGEKFQWRGESRSLILDPTKSDPLVSPRGRKFSMIQAPSPLFPGQDLQATCRQAGGRDAPPPFLGGSPPWGGEQKVHTHLVSEILCCTHQVVLPHGWRLGCWSSGGGQKEAGAAERPDPWGVWLELTWCSPQALPAAAAAPAAAPVAKGLHRKCRSKTVALASRLPRSHFLKAQH